MKKKLINLGLLLALISFSLASLVACRSAATDNRVAVPRPAETANVTQTLTLTGSVKPDTVQHITVDGRLAFVDHRSLTFGTSGKIGQVNVRELDGVKKGEVLATLETSTLERAVNIAELTLSSAEVDREQAEFAVKSAEIDLEQASDNFRKIAYPYNYHTFAFDVPAAIVSIHEAELQLKEVRVGLDIGPSSEEYATAQHQLALARDNLAQAREMLSRGVGVDLFVEDNAPLAVKDFWTLRAAQLSMEKAGVNLDNAKNNAIKAKVAAEKAKYDLDTAKDMLDKAVITAPFDGVIAKVKVEEGDYLSAYATTIAIEVIDPSYMELNVEVYELDIPNVALGQKVTISVDALPDERFEGVVTSIGSLPGSATGAVSYEVKIAFDVPQDLALKAGMGAIADIAVEKR